MALAVAVAAVVAVALPAPGGDGRTSIEVSVLTEGPGGPIQTRMFDCASSGLEGKVCSRLTGLAPDAFERERGRVCTQVYGGPARARVKGQLDGERLNTTFTLANGCEIARWRRFAWLIGPVP